MGHPLSLGEIGGAGVLENTRSLGSARDDRFLCWGELTSVAKARFFCRLSARLKSCPSLNPL
jgi:hypothetical protein